MNGSEGIGRGGGEDGVQANSSLGALPSSTAFLGGGGNGNGGPFQLPNGLTRQDSFGMSLAGGAMHGAMHPMLRQDSFARLNAANLAFSGGALGNAVGNAVGHGGLDEGLYDVDVKMFIKSIRGRVPRMSRRCGGSIIN